ncbi:MAG: UDP-glucose 4-epimerase GalE [Porticoccaceae bacterium]|nr:UDP-glucose 4-epimerase GalE [Porticoccaceae bacterium]
MAKTVLVTGGAGYIGSHAVVALQQAGYAPILLDNFSNAHPAVIDRIGAITGYAPTLVEGDIRDRSMVRRLFEDSHIDGVIHFAGLKAVGESVMDPLRYYHNNVVGSLVLFEEMARANCKHLVFSSSATVYGDPASVPIGEDFPLIATNPYGQSKLMIETVLRDLCDSDPDWQVALLRYFNPVGAHPSGLIGEDPAGVPNNLLPFIAQVAIGRLEKLHVFGNDYPTRDGTGVRDYIHVWDLALGHLAALEHLQPGHGAVAYNLGTGQGYSVLEMIRAFEAVAKRTIPYEIVDRRPGDVAECYADIAFSAKALGWRAERGLQKMVEDHWRWQQRNPQGYDSVAPPQP